MSFESAFRKLADARYRYEELRIAGAPIGQLVDARVELMGLRMKATRGVRCQTMAHVAARDDGDATRQRVRGGSDGLAQGGQPIIPRIIEAENDRWPGPTGLGKKPKRH